MQRRVSTFALQQMWHVTVPAAYRMVLRLGIADISSSVIQEGHGQVQRHKICQIQLTP